MQNTKNERHHGAALIGVMFRIGLVKIIGGIERMVEGIELVQGIGETTQFDQGEEVVGEVSEVVMGFREVGTRLDDFVENSEP